LELIHPNMKIELLRSTNRFSSLVTLLASFCCPWDPASALPAGLIDEMPNIVVILTDDQGYADISFNPQHPEEVSTPNMDALAQEGVFFRQAYNSGHVCSPTRAGLMLGQYQQRVRVYSAGDGGRGFSPEQAIFPSCLITT